MYKLNPHQVSTIGRGTSNRISVMDEMCSRNHAEIFQIEGGWVLRDLGSRNGTYVNGVQIRQDVPLYGGEQIRIGAYHLGFQLNSDAFEPVPVDQTGLISEKDRTAEMQARESSGMSTHEIVSRRSKTRFHELDANLTTEQRQAISDSLFRLYRLALRLGTAANAHELSRMVLEHLVSTLGVDIGAVLMFPEKPDAMPEKGSSGYRSQKLSVVAYESREEVPYQKVSASISELVFDSGEAILAKDVPKDERLAQRDSLGRIQAKSLICAPIRKGERVFGLIHLYTTNTDNTLTSEDLEYTLALADQFSQMVLTLRERESLQKGLQVAETENKTLKRQLEIESEIVGVSLEVNRMKSEIRQIAETDAIVLVRGESGVGKELVARAIHFQSPRRSNAFVCLNCAALSESLLESELFGHEKGSFTGATARKIGKFEAADNGTLFLDEVGEMSLSIQAKFLRVLEGHPFERVGGNVPIRSNVRLVAATNRDLENAVREGQFRKDLYFRLHVVEIVVPPLCERKDDIPELAMYFVQRIAEKNGRVSKEFDTDAIQLLKEYSWPGNIRELKHTVERAFLLSRGDELSTIDLKFSNLDEEFDDLSAPADLLLSNMTEQSLEQIEQKHILGVLEANSWNKSRAAQILGIERSTLDRKLKKYGLNRN